MSNLSKLIDLLSQGWVSTGIGAGLAFYFYIKSRKRKLVRYCFERTWFISSRNFGNGKNILISFYGTAVPRLASNILYFWNAGEVPISGLDILPSRPLRVSLRNDPENLSAQIVGYRLLKKSKEYIECNFCLNEGKRELYITYNHLERGDGFAIELLHTAASNSLFFSGHLSGLDRELETSTSKNRFMNMRSFNSTDGYRPELIVRVRRYFDIINPGILTIIMGIVMVVYPIFKIIYPFDDRLFYSNTDMKSIDIAIIDMSSIFGVLVGLLYIYIGYVIFLSLRRLYPKSLVVLESDRAEPSLPLRIG